MEPPTRPYYEEQIPIRDAPSDAHAIDALIHQRPRILKIKLAVLATQILERLRIREHNASKIDRQLLETANKLVPFEEHPPVRSNPDTGLRNLLLDAEAKLAAELRSQDVECWRDVAQLMNEFLAVWEAVEQSRVRAEFLRDQRTEDRE